MNWSQCATAAIIVAFFAVMWVVGQYIPESGFTGGDNWEVID